MTKSIDPTQISQPALHNILLTAVAPRPIAFASTIDKAGNVNLSPFSFFNVFSSNPPVMIFSPARSGRDLSLKHTYLNIKKVPEVTINIVNYPMVEQMSLASTAYPKGVNEFVKAGFTEVASSKIHPPRVGEAPVSFECLVDQVIELGEGGGAGNLVISRVIMIHIQEEYLDEKGNLDTKKLNLVGRMGGPWYTRSSGDSLFQIPKPIFTKGIGIDQLPKHIRESNVLTGNNLGRLGNVERLPTEEAILARKKTPEVVAVLEDAQALHELAKKILEAGDVQKALEILM